MLSYGYFCHKAGLEITAGQTFILDVMLTGQNAIVLKTKQIKASCCSVVSVIVINIDRVAVYCITLI